MSMVFADKDIESISKVLNAEPEREGKVSSFKILDKKGSLLFALSIYDDADLSEDKKGALVSVQTRSGYHELHDCSRFVLFEPDEIVFIQETENYLNSLIVSAGGSCSSYSNVDKKILKTDIEKLDPAVLLAAMQLSIADAAFQNV